MHTYTCRNYIWARNGILDYLWEGFLGPPGHLNIRNPKHLDIQLNWADVSYYTSGASWSGLPSTYLNATIIYI